MKTSVFLDDALANEVKKTASLAGEDQNTILNRAIRAGLPVVANSVFSNPPEGYFKGDYERHDPEREQFEEAVSKIPQTPDR